MKQAALGVSSPPKGNLSTDASIESLEVQPDATSFMVLPHADKADRVVESFVEPSVPDQKSYWRLPLAAFLCDCPVSGDREIHEVLVPKQPHVQLNVNLFALGKHLRNGLTTVVREVHEDGFAQPPALCQRVLQEVALDGVARRVARLPLHKRIRDGLRDVWLPRRPRQTRGSCN
eukprot:CAMPEP_0177534020 /NCGR_PEP_ID=MMETSP0369-20130122/55682_1 /TAXON_ID=447022 ORGANISM="Scrippsiella hangoei-like, Strain SHHI-4" /NCGR_SAMPLE_ID=MMETSP0369 /ASSEMBLY_ACC=CAM_ASM_000364 /LENGTH=174 /DNA_ID=CAMNT_0019015859 /DNA_START=321 /DNA_END=846 /DNA_ORIENTATION=+